MYITVEKLSKELNKSIRQIQYMVKNGVAIPVNLDTHRRDGGYRFSVTEIQRLKKIYNRDDLSLKEASKIVGVTPQYLNQLAIENKISSEMVLIGNREERRFEEKNCHILRDDLNSKSHSKRHIKYGEKLVIFKNGVRLFQQVEHEGARSRVIKTNPLILLTENGTLVDNIVNIEPELEWPVKPYITKKGFIEYLIPIPRSFDHPIYELFYTMIEQVGPKNIQFFETNESDYYVRCRQTNLEIKKSQFNLLQRFLVKGKMYIKGDKIILSTDIEQIYIDLPTTLLSTLKVEAINKNISLSSLILEKLSKNMDI